MGSNLGSSLLGAPLNTSMSCAFIYHLMVYLFLLWCVLTRLDVLPLIYFGGPSLRPVGRVGGPFCLCSPPVLWIAIGILLQNCSSSSKNSYERAGL